MEPDPSQPYGHLLFSDPPILPQLLHVSVLFLSRMSLTTFCPWATLPRAAPGSLLCHHCGLRWLCWWPWPGESTVSTGTCEHCGGGVAPFSLWGPAWTNLSSGPCPVYMAEGQSDGPVPPCQAQGSVPVLDLLVCEDALAWKCRTTPLQSHCLFPSTPRLLHLWCQLLISLCEGVAAPGCPGGSCSWKGAESAISPGSWGAPG